MRKVISSLVALLLVWFLFYPGNSQVQAQAGDPYSLVAAVNQLRAANGLPALEVNSVLMGIAQGHSDYQASIGNVTHYGPGGSRPRDRAAAAGYGGGATFFISENIAGGTNLSVDGAISMWLMDDLHINTMLGANYREIGAGVSVSGDFVYYTIDTAYVAGGSYSTPATTPAGGYGATPIPVYFVQTATPNPDGSISHVVQSGQTLIGIAQAYGVSVAEIKALNGLTGDDIYVGDVLVIRPANTPSPSETTTATTTPTRAATPTRQPTRTPTATLTPDENLQAGGTATAQVAGAMPRQDVFGNILIGAVILFGGGGILLMVMGGLLKRGRE